MSYARNYALAINEWVTSQSIDKFSVFTRNNEISMETLFSKGGAGAFVTSKSVTIKSQPTNF